MNHEGQVSALEALEFRHEKKKIGKEDGTIFQLENK